VPEGKQSYRLNLEDGSWVQYGSKKERGTPCRRAGFSEGLKHGHQKHLAGTREPRTDQDQEVEDRMSRGAASVAKERLTSYSTAAIQSNRLSVDQSCRIVSEVHTCRDSIVRKELGSSGRQSIVIVVVIL